MLLRTYIRHVVRQSRAIRPIERAAVVAMWRIGWRPKRAAGWLQALDELKRGDDAKRAALRKLFFEG